jgi:hypothetical protein
MKINRRSPYAESVVDFVESNPGCCKYDVAKHVTHHPMRCPSKQYYIVNNQIECGNLIANKLKNKYELFVNPNLTT